jgi:hypothetical protein
VFPEVLKELVPLSSRVEGSPPVCVWCDALLSPATTFYQLHKSYCAD